jgi:hypothetical protein
MVLAIVTLAGCSSLTYSNSRLDALQSELDRRYTLWKGQHIPSYDYRFERACQCDTLLTRPVIVTVLDSAVAGATYVDGGSAVPDSILSSYFTVDDLFSQVQIAINLATDSLYVEYDPTYHYPTRIVIDQTFQQVGDELSLFSSNLMPKQP